MAKRTVDEFGNTLYDDQTENTRALGDETSPNPDTTKPAILPPKPPAAPGWDASRVSQYFADKGVTPNATSPDYWAGKWNEWGQYDPAYFEHRLSQADEFTGNTMGEVSPRADPTLNLRKTPNPGLIQPERQTTTPPPPPRQDDTISKLLEQMLAKNNETAGKRTSMLNTINGLISKYSAPVTRDDPGIAPLASAFEGDTQRATKRFQKQAAERAHAEGVGTGAFDAAIGGSVLQGGRDSANFETQLMHDEMLSRRSALSDQLDKGASLLSAQDQTDIQGQIAAIDANLKSRGLDITESQGNRALDISGQTMNNNLFLGKGQLDLGGRNLDLQKLLGLSGLDLQRYLGDRSLTNQETGLRNQNTQWYDQFAYNAGKDQSGLDKFLMDYLLNTR